MPTLLISLAALLWAPQAAPEITVEPLAEGRYRLTVTAEGTGDPAVAQRLLDPKAAALCGDQGYSYGRFQFQASTPAPGEPSTTPDSITLRQELGCGAALLAPPPAPGGGVPTRPPANEAEAKALQDRILTLSDRFLDAVGAGDAGTAFELSAPEMTGASRQDWTERLAAGRGERGALTSRQVARVSLYIDPPGVQPGLYVAADYVADWENAEECGYLVWRADKLEGPFLLTRQEQTLLPRDLPADQRAAMRQQYCIIL